MMSVDREELITALRAAIKIAEEARQEWDAAPNAMRAGKLLIALAGHIKGYRPDIDAIHATLSKVYEVSDPDFIYDPLEWETTYEWSDRSTLVEDRDIVISEPQQFRTLVHGPDKWAARVVLTRDDCGDPDETEIQWFDSKADVLAAAANEAPR